MKTQLSIFLVLLLSHLTHAAESTTAESTTRICFGRLHPECFLVEGRNVNGKKEYRLALTSRGRVTDERVLAQAEHEQLIRAIRLFKSAAKPESELCPSPVKFEQFKGEELMDTQSYCARKSESEVLRSELRNGSF